VPRSRDPEKVSEENRALRAENREVRREADRLRKRLVALDERIDELRERQQSLVATIEKSDDLLRWLRARVQILEREMEGT
jgi:phage shock protein A